MSHIVEFTCPVENYDEGAEAGTVSVTVDFGSHSNLLKYEAGDWAYDGLAERINKILPRPLVVDDAIEANRVADEPNRLHIDLRETFLPN